MPPTRPRAGQPGRRPPKRRHRSWLGQVFIGLVIIVGMGLLGLATGIALMVGQIPSVESLLAARPLGATTIYDRTGRVVASLQNGENRELVPLAEISKPLQQAVIASEDIRFYEHHGLDARGLARALVSGGTAGGGSTLTQQLAKNLFLSADRTLTRKIADMWLAIQLERTLSKDKILEMYLNQVYFGHGAYGAEAASHKYFGKHARAINTAEAAMLVGLLPAPEYYSPYRNPKPAKERQAIVLQRMVDAGYIEQKVAHAEAQRKLVYANTPEYAYRAPYFVSQVLSTLSERLGPDLVMRGALKIYTTLDLPLQETAETLIRKGVARYQRLNVGQGALVAVEPGTGAVRVLVGGTDYDASQFNRATQAHRQPGSTFKPFVYVTAFGQGYTPWSTVLDAAVSFGSYAPQNYDRRYHGTVTLERALAFSYNIPAVKMASAVGINNVVKTAHDAGIKSPMRDELSVALGAAEVTPLELASAYATFAADGVYAEPHLVTRVEDHDGNLIDQFSVTAQPVIAEAAVGALNHCLMAVVNYGSGAGANFGRPAAGKTGTTSENRDTWFAGYTPDLACVIWLGNDNNSRLSSVATGGMLAAPLWSQFMRTAHAGLPIRQLKTASGTGEAASPSPGEASASPGDDTTVASPEPAVASTEPDSPAIEGTTMPEEDLPSPVVATPAPARTPRPEPSEAAQVPPQPAPSMVVIQ